MVHVRIYSCFYTTNLFSRIRLKIWHFSAEFGKNVRKTPEIKENVTLFSRIREKRFVVIMSLLPLLFLFLFIFIFISIYIFILRACIFSFLIMSLLPLFLFLLFLVIIIYIYIFILVSLFRLLFLFIHFYYLYFVCNGFHSLFGVFHCF